MSGTRIPTHQPSANTLRFAKVVQHQPAHGTTTIVYIDGPGGIATNVRHLQRSAGTNYGSVDNPEVTVKKDDPFDPAMTQDRDSLAVVAEVNGQAVIIGYAYQGVNQLGFDHKKFPNLKIDRHASDFLTVTDNSGSTGFNHPSGTTIQIGNPPSLEGQDFDKKYKTKNNTSDRKRILLLVPMGNGTVAAMIELTPDGFVSISAADSVLISAVKAIRLTASKIYLN